MSLDREEIAYLLQKYNNIDTLKKELNTVRRIIEVKRKILGRGHELTDDEIMEWITDLTSDEREEFYEMGAIPYRIIKNTLKTLPEDIIKLEQLKIVVENGDYDPAFRAKVVDYYREIMGEYALIFMQSLESFRELHKSYIINQMRNIREQEEGSSADYQRQLDPSQNKSVPSKYNKLGEHVKHSEIVPPASYMAQSTPVSTCPSCKTRIANDVLKCGHKVCNICKDTLISENGNCPRCKEPVYEDSDEEARRKYLKYKNKYLKLKKNYNL
jgi:hypothetical protein